MVATAQPCPQSRGPEEGRSCLLSQLLLQRDRQSNHLLAAGSGQLTGSRPKPHYATLIKQAGCSLFPWVYIHILTASIERDLPE